MPAIRMVEEDEATDEVRELYGEIKSTLGIDFVPNMYKLMAPNPPLKGANIGVAVAERVAWEDRGHGFLLPLPRRPGSVGRVGS
jgi:hypothetical protein